jgi:hypothetical protein
MTADVLVAGAGLSGLMAARALRSQGLRVTVVDKGRSVGGRLATRRIGPGRADHGAQFFTVRTPAFQKWVYDWLARGLVYRWSTGWSDGSSGGPPPDGHPRYVVRGGMNALAKHLAGGLEVQVDVRLVSVTPAGDGWQARDEQGRIYAGQALLLTPPVPQSLALLDAGQARLAPGTPSSSKGSPNSSKGTLSLSKGERTALERIAYAPCLAGLFRVQGPVQLPEPGAVQRPEAPISWIADNRRKGISPGATLLTVHAGPDYSRQLWDAPQAEALAALRAGLHPFLGSGTTIREAQLKRWRYALPTALHPERCLMAAGLPPLVLAGDAFGEPRIEGAALSGLAAAEAIREA